MGGAQAYLSIGTRRRRGGGGGGVMSEAYRIAFEILGSGKWEK